MNNELNRTATSDFRECSSLLLLEQYEKRRCAETFRESQIAERNAIYASIINNPSSVHCLLQYTDYVDEKNHLLIDFEKWILDFPCDLLHQLENIQPVKLKNTFSY